MTKAIILNVYKLVKAAFITDIIFHKISPTFSL